MPVQRVRCFSALSSGLTPPTPPPPTIRPPNAAADHQFVGAQLYSLFRQWVFCCSIQTTAVVLPIEKAVQQNLKT